jgi:hypothetical protein
MPNKTTNTKLADKKPAVSTIPDTKLFTKLKRQANNYYDSLFKATMVGIPMSPTDRCEHIAQMEMFRRAWLMDEATEHGFSDEEISKRIKRDTKSRQKFQGPSAEQLAALDRRIPDPTRNFFRL